MQASGAKSQTSRAPSALAMTLCIMPILPIEFVCENVQQKIEHFNWLIPSLALWMFSVRHTDLRVLLWASIPAMIFHLPALPVCGIFITLADRCTGKLRHFADELLSSIAVLTLLIFTVTLLFDSEVIYGSKRRVDVTQRLAMNGYDMVIVASERRFTNGHCDYSIQKHVALGPWFRLAYPVQVQHHGIYSNLKKCGDVVTCDVYPFDW